MTHKLFVYGTLKQGFHNHRFLEGAKFLGVDTTKDSDFAIFDLGFCPAVGRCGDDRVAGELYEIDDSTLDLCDMLESNGRLYTREIVALSGGDEAWMYLINGDRLGMCSIVQSQDGVASWPEKVEGYFFQSQG